MTALFSRLVSSLAGVCQRIEALTLSRLLPLMAREGGNMAHTLSLRLKDLHEVVAALTEVQDRLVPHLDAMAKDRRLQAESRKELLGALHGLKKTVKKGFRLDQQEP